jgi:GTP-binding protein Era
MTDYTTKSGFIALLGRPNVGKSTLLNQFIGQKVSITSKKPQTTRHQILGIHTEGDHQLVFIDTPGIHLHHKKALNRYMNKAALTTIKDVDIILFMVEALKFTEEDKFVLEALKDSKRPVFLIINKVDEVKEKARLLPFIESLSAEQEFAHIFPISALKNQQVEGLKETLYQNLPQGPFYYLEDQVTDRPMRFLASEIVREKVFRNLGQEVPYASTVVIDLFKKQDNGVTHIAATIFVARESHKRMIIGEKGEKLKQIGSSARADLETLCESKVYLQLWCKVKSGWFDSERALQGLGYED